MDKWRKCVEYIRVHEPIVYEECFAANKACRFAVGGLLDGGRLDGGLTRRRYADHIFKMVQRFVAASALYESFFVVANIVNLLSLIKTLDLLRFHKRLALLTSTIEDAAVDILHFLIMAGLDCVNWEFIFLHKAGLNCAKLDTLLAQGLAIHAKMVPW